MKMLKVLGKKGRITIPFEIRQRVGFAYNDVLSFTSARGSAMSAAQKEQRLSRKTGITMDLSPCLNSSTD